MARRRRSEPPSQLRLQATRLFQGIRVAKLRPLPQHIGGCREFFIALRLHPWILAAGSCTANKPSGWAAMAHRPAAGFPLFLGTMLGKTVPTSVEIVAWRGLRHDASKSSTVQGWFRVQAAVGFDGATTLVTSKAQATRLKSVPPQPNPVLQSTAKNCAASGKLSTMIIPV